MQENDCLPIELINVSYTLEVSRLKEMISGEHWLRTRLANYSHRYYKKSSTRIRGHGSEGDLNRKER